MNKITLSLAVAGIIIIAGLCAAPFMTNAVYTSLSLATTGNGDSVQMTVTGETYSSVTFYYQRNGYQTQSQYLGSTDSSGRLTTVIGTSAYGITTGSPVYVVVGSVQSPSLTWPSTSGYNNGYNGYYGAPSLSQTSVSVAVGQSVNVIISGGSSPYTMYASVDNIFRPVIGGNTLAVAGTVPGSASLSVCSSGGLSSGCATLYVTVTSANNNTWQNITLGQNSVSLNAGSTTSVSVYGNGNYYLSSNGNSDVASAYITGNTISVTGKNYGSTSVVICQNSGQCATLYVTVNGSSQQISLSQTSITLNAGSSGTVTVYGGGNYYISSAGNSDVASAYVSGSTVTVTGRNYGNTTVNVCQNGGQCTSLYVTVNGSGQTTGTAVTFSRTSPVLVTGQSISISLYGGSGSGYYVAYNSNPSAVSASVNGSTLNLTGNSYTGAGIVVCSSSNSCGALSVSVGTVAGAETSNVWTSCGGEGNQCYFSGTQLVRYGANGYYAYRTLSGPVSCSNSVFGDPLFGVVKQCSYGGTN